MSRPRRASFVRFCEGLGVKLTPGQRVIALVALDGVEPGSLRGAERELARRIFGDVETIPAEARHVLAAVCGARGGKTYVLVALRMLHLALTVSLETLAPGEQASGIIVAPDLRLARQALRYVSGAAERRPELAAMVASETSDSLTLRRPDGIVTIECLPATRGGSALRGRSLVGAALDEAAFFRDDSYQVNDVEVFKAVAPRVMAGGQVVIASTPWAEAGLLYDLHVANHGRPQTALSAHAPTTVLRDDARTRGLVERERLRDPDNAAREFEAEFMAAGSGAFFDPRIIDAAIDPSRPLSLPHSPGMVASVAVDLAFESDASAAVAIYRDGSGFTVADLLELRPAKGSPLTPSAVVGAFASFAKARGAFNVASDVHYRQAAIEYLQAAGLGFRDLPGGQSGKVAQYTIARSLLNDGRVRLPPHPRLIAQLKAIVSKPTPGGGLSISSPRQGGSHGDIASAFVGALYMASQEAADYSSVLMLTERLWESGACRTRF